MNFSPTRYHDEAVRAQDTPSESRPGGVDPQPPRPQGLGISGAFLIATLSTALLAFILGAWVRVLVVLFDSGWNTI